MPLPAWLIALLVAINGLMPIWLPLWDILKVRFGLVPSPAPGQPVANPFFDQLAALVGLGATRDEAFAEIKAALADGKIDLADATHFYQWVLAHPAYASVPAPVVPPLAVPVTAPAPAPALSQHLEAPK
jgi:hypothetical protein